MKIIKNPNLAEYSSIRIGGLGNFLYMPETEKELIELIPKLDNPVVLGGGTNVIFADSFNGDVISLQNFANKELVFSASNVIVSAGVKLSKLVYEGCRLGLSGVEALAGIPGTFGGAIVMNAGSRYGSISEFVKSVRVFSFSSFSGMIFNVSDMDYKYRSSSLQNNSNYIVLSGELEFQETAPPEILVQRASSIIRERITSKIKLPNCGSIFKNPEHELSAGAMIDRLGMKGYAINDIMISEYHGNIFVNNSFASYSDFISLVEEVKERVYIEYGVELCLEVKVLD